jgi:uncharacterized membrane protein
LTQVSYGYAALCGLIVGAALGVTAAVLHFTVSKEAL